MTLAGLQPRIAAVGVQDPALLIVDQIGDHHLVQHLRMNRRIFDRHHIFDPPIEIARHPVGRADVDPGLAVRQPGAVGEYEDAAVLEEAADDRFYPDI